MALAHRGFGRAVGPSANGAGMTSERALSESLVGNAVSKAEIERMLNEITVRAVANAAGEVGAALSVLARGEVLSIGATSAAAEKMDHGQVLDDEGPCLSALRSGIAVSVTDYDADTRWPAMARRAAEAGIRSSLSIPLKTGDQILGALNVYSNSRDAFDVDSLLSLGAFADQATTSLALLGDLQQQRDNTAYVNEFSATVQESLRTALPRVAGLELVGGSVPAAPRAVVGGDWYDALVLPDAAVGLVIGDVMGHGIEAVTAMAQLRTMVRSGAWLGAAPGEVVRMADELAQLSGITETATLFYGRLTAHDAGAQLSYCNAGHLHPLLRHPDGEVTSLDSGSRPLLGALAAGSESTTTFASGVVELAPRSVLLLYTDGVVERDETSLDEATATLCRALADFPLDAPLQTLVHALLEVPNARDDITVFAVRVTH